MIHILVTEILIDQFKINQMGTTKNPHRLVILTSGVAIRQATPTHCAPKL